MSEVIALNKSVVAPGQVNPEAVKVLEHFLEKAKRGEVIAVGVAAVAPNDWIIKGSAYPQGYRWGLNTAIDYLKADMLAAMLKESNDA